MSISSEARKDRNILWTSVLKLLRGSSRVLLFREFDRFGPNLEIEIPHYVCSGWVNVVITS